MRRVLWSAAVVAGVVACGEVVGSIPPGTDDDDVITRDGAADAPITQADGAADASTDALVDAAPDGGGCVPERADETTSIFVATTGSAGAACGTLRSPCRSINTAIARAAAAKRATVRVARGTYLETLDLRAGVRIEGGWEVAGDGAFMSLCEARRQAVVIKAPAGGTETVVAEDLGGSAELAQLTVETSPAVTPGGTSLYGIVALGTTTTLALSNVRIEVAAGGDGINGGTGQPGVPPAVACRAGNGSDGTAGPPGTGADIGVFGVGGYQRRIPVAGGPGDVAGNGQSGGLATCVQCGSCDDSCTFNPGPVRCGTDGEHGCAGGPGGGGLAARGGGSSIGLYVWDAAVTVTGGVIHTSDGGRGGTGGDGGVGAAGSLGQAGIDGSLCVTGCTMIGAAGRCINEFGRGESGLAGGAGGRGGNGGPGGGGAGGHSLAVFHGGTGTVTTTNATLEPGTAGIAGGPVSAAGAAGISAARYPD